VQVNRSTLTAIGIVAAILLAGYGLGYTSHKEYVPITITSTEFRTVTMTETITTTVYEVKNITVLLYKPVEWLDVKVRRISFTTLRVYLTNRGNTTLYNIVVYVRLWEHITGFTEPIELIISDIEPGITRTIDVTLSLFSSYVYICILVPQPIPTS
jgi:hypothetical protein